MVKEEMKEEEEEVDGGGEDPSVNTGQGSGQSDITPVWSHTKAALMSV